MRTALILLLAASLPAWPADFPSAELSNGVVTAKFYLPDPERGYYRGTRFDWSGQIYSLRTLGHEYFGQWFERYDPKLHDAIMGPVEEFRSGDFALGYPDAKPGGTFIRIGVGVLRKPADDAKYENFRTYDIVDPGKWKVKHPGLRPLHAQALELLREYDEIDLAHVPREQNTDADLLVNAALDAPE